MSVVNDNGSVAVTAIIASIYKKKRFLNDIMIFCRAEWSKIIKEI